MKVNGTAVTYQTNFMQTTLKLLCASLSAE